MKVCFNPASPGLFSRSAGLGGSEAQMPKIKVNINRLKWNLAWVIMAIKAFLMQNLSPIARLVLEIWRHKNSLWRKEWFIKFDYLSPENGFNLKKNEFLCPESLFSTQNWSPCQFQQFLKSLHFILAQSGTSNEFIPLSFKLLLSSPEWFNQLGWLSTVIKNTVT